MSRQLPDEYLSDLFDRLEAAAQDYAIAKAERFGLAEHRKILKNQMMMVAEAEGRKSHVAQERFAYTHPTYIQLVDDLTKAIKRETDLEYACKLIEMEWGSQRTHSANLRAARV